MEAFEGEGWPGTVADQALDAWTVVALDAPRGVDAEPGGRGRLEDPKCLPPALRSSPAGSLPDPPAAGARHATGIGLVEKAARAEIPEHAMLNDTLEVEPVVLVEQGGLVEADSVVGDVREDAVEDHEVEVEVGIERRSEAVQEGDGAESGVAGCAGAGGSKRRADGAEEDLQDGAGDVRVVVEVGAQALGQ